MLKNKIVVLVIILAVGIIISPLEVEAVSNEAEQIIEEKDYFIYTIEEGDTLFEIALENDTTTEMLISLNDLKDGDLIYFEQELKIPEDDTQGYPDPEPVDEEVSLKDFDAEEAAVGDVEPEKLEQIIENEEYFIYSIKTGDTLFELALENDTTTDMLVSLNELKEEDNIFVDQKLIIPETEEMEDKSEDIEENDFEEENDSEDEETENDGFELEFDDDF